MSPTQDAPPADHGERVIPNIIDHQGTGVTSECRTRPPRRATGTRRGPAVTGLVRIDLSRHLLYGALYAGDDAAREVYRSVVPPGVAVLIDIGDAHRFGMLDARIVEQVAEAGSITVVGADAGGIGETVQHLRDRTGGAS